MVKIFNLQSSQCFAGGFQSAQSPSEEKSTVKIQPVDATHEELRKHDETALRGRFPLRAQGASR
jgi:hypothetical protein